MHTIRVGVLMGGRSIEREVSFNSGRTVCDHLDTACYTVIPLFQTVSGKLYLLPWKFLHRGKISDFEHRLVVEAESLAWDDLKNHIDFMYIATHGTYAEDGKLQGFLEVLGIPYLGSGVFASALGMNKTMQKSFMQHAGINVPRGITVTAAQIANFKHHEAGVLEQLAAQGVFLPYVVKPEHEGSSLGITVVHTLNDLHDALVRASQVNPGHIQSVLIEEKLEGMEFSCITLVNNETDSFIPLPPTEIVPEIKDHIFDYEQKYMPGRASKFTPARCDQTTLTCIQETCVAATRALHMTTISRIDGFVTLDGRVVIIDPNTLSGMAPTSFLFSQAAVINMSHTQVINHLIETELTQLGIRIKSNTHKNHGASMQAKIRIAVLMGGNSNEREISLESGRNVTYKLSPHRYEVVPIFVNQDMELFKLTNSLLVRNSTKEINALVTDDMRVLWNDLPALVDFVFIGLHGGSGENGSVQGTLEMLDLPYNGSSILASSLCMDKYKTNIFLKKSGFSVPEHFFVARQAWLADQESVIKGIKAQIPFPLIVKPHDDGCSVMVAKVSTDRQLADAITELIDNNKSGAFVEECIVGMELTVGVIGNDVARALPPSQAVSAHGILSIEEKFLPGAGENQTPAPLPQEQLALVQQVVAKAYNALGCSGYARVDCFYQSAKQSPTGSERVVVLEINTLPGLTPATCIFHQAAELGIKPMDFIDCIVQLGFQRYYATQGERESLSVNHKGVLNELFIP